VDLDILKGLYQNVEARLPQIWCDIRYEYSKDEAIRMARSNIASRVGPGLQEINFILIIPIVNWETVLISSFSKIGTCHHCEVESTHFFDSTESWRTYKSTNTQKILEFFGKHYDETKLNVVFLYLSEFHLNIESIEKLKKINTLVINFNWVDILHYKRYHKGQSAGIVGLAKTVDFNLTMCISSMTRYVGDRAAVFYWNGLDKPEDFKPKIVTAKEKRVLFFGTRYGSRGPLIEYLKKRGIPIEVYGKGWGTRFIEYDELFEKIQSCVLNLGISTIAYSRTLCNFKGRDLEVPSIGGLYLVNDHPEITNVYEPNVEVLVYRNKTECYNKICKVLENPERFQNVKLAGAKKAASLSWDSRCRYLLSIINKILKR